MVLYFVFLLITLLLFLYRLYPIHSSAHNNLGTILTNTKVGCYFGKHKFGTGDL